MQERERVEVVFVKEGSYAQQKLRNKKTQDKTLRNNSSSRS